MTGRPERTARPIVEPPQAPPRVRSARVPRRRFLMRSAVALLGCWAGASSRAPRARAAETRLIRVGILIDRPSVQIAADGPVIAEDVSLSMYAQPVPAALSQPPGGAGWITTASGAGGLDFSGAPFGPAVRLTCREGLLRADGRPYRGVLELRRTPAGRVTVINILDVESYLYGVIKAEMEPRWPREAVRAQAIAARTLALHRILSTSQTTSGAAAGGGNGGAFDLPATTDVQVYLGAAAEEPAASAAVDTTRGLVATYNGRPIFAAYHSNSGGHTEDSENVWGASYPYLRGVPDPYALQAPGVSWTAVLPLGGIAAALEHSGVDLTGLTDVAVGRATPWGRAFTVLLRDETSRTQEINANRFRLLVGAGVVRSTLFSVTRQGGDVLFNGRGSGHGVGLDQWGARAMAAQGFTYEQILRYYYTGVAIEPRS
jgi:stage II sporulation protein D